MQHSVKDKCIFKTCIVNQEGEVFKDFNAAKIGKYLQYDQEHLRQTYQLRLRNPDYHTIQYNTILFIVHIKPHGKFVCTVHLKLKLIYMIYIPIHT